MSRKALIQEVEKELNCRLMVLYYNTEDQPFLTQLASDVLSPLKDALSQLKMDSTDKPLAVLLQSSGGVLESPWPIVSGIRASLRAKKNEFWVIVNDRAHSAATLVALAADKIWMSPFGSLSPIDPQLNLNTAPNVRIGAGIEDIQGFYDLICNMFERDESARVQAFNLLAQRIPPEVLGRVQRVHELIKLLSQKMLSTRKQAVNGEMAEKLTKALTKDFFSHDYRISDSECGDLGLPVQMLEGKAQNAVDNLWNSYRAAMEIGKDLTISIPPQETQAKVVKQRAFVETAEIGFVFQSEVIVNRDKTAQINDLGWRTI